MGARAAALHPAPDDDRDDARRMRDARRPRHEIAKDEERWLDEWSRLISLGRLEPGS